MIEAAGGKLPGFYGMFAQDYNVAMIVEAPGNAEYIGGIAPELMAGTFSDLRSIPPFTAAEMQKASRIAKNIAASHQARKA